MNEIRKDRLRLIYVIMISLFVILVVGVSFAFFNYTRTGAANNIGTGTIYFSSNQSDTLSITNAFPLKESQVSGANLDSIEIAIEGRTTYSNGEEFLISITDVNNIVNNFLSPKGGIWISNIFRRTPKNITCQPNIFRGSSK